jgi:hypothetical protein
MTSDVSRGDDVISVMNNRSCSILCRLGVPVAGEGELTDPSDPSDASLPVRTRSWHPWLRSCPHKIFGFA